ncbi:MAG TPA: hypothetical protein VHM91_19165, partial [Verrucomicrobiales bacterium]|nr:hypothetical protein [Verrucomicrobiales bacterium]
MNLKCEILSAAVTFREQPFAKPLQLSSGTITEITEATVEVRVLAGGREATGRSSIYLSDLWAWPDPAYTHAQRDEKMREYCLRTTSELAEQNSGRRHPIELGMSMHRRIGDSTGDGSIPFLAGLVCVSPFDAALHDGAGRALGLSAFRFYDASGAGDDGESDMLFPGKGALAAVHDFLLPQPSRAVDGWYVVSGTDPLAGDFRAFVQQRGFRCFKLKTHGKDSEADARRTAEVFQAARALGVKRPRLSADSNEG